MSRCYVGRCATCKQVVAAVVDVPGREKETAKDVADFIREGLVIEPMDTEQVRVTLRGCNCPKAKQLDLLPERPA